MAEDALSSFESLLTSIPAWIAELEQITTAATTRQRQLLLANQDCGGEMLPPKSPRRKPSKSSSLQSSWSDKARRRSADMLRPQLPHLTNSDALRLSQRDRKTASAASGDVNAQGKYRSRSLIVVYYDGDVQKGFEQLVRSVATSRNDIRKGKMGARVDALSRTGSSSSDSGSSGGEETTSSFTNKLRYNRTTRAMQSAFGRDDGLGAFDRVDSRLEKGQALCERAAHQILRDGDCDTELIKIKDLFNEALTFTQAELPALRRRAEKAIARRRRSEERQRSEERRRSAKADAKLDYERASIVLHAMPPGEVCLEADALEVDDDGSDSEIGEYDTNAFQMSKISQYRRGPPPISRQTARAYT